MRAASASYAANTLTGSTVARGETWWVALPRRGPCTISLLAVVIPNVVVSPMDSLPMAPSYASSWGCQSDEYVSSNLVVIRSIGAPIWPVAVILNMPPGRLTVTSSVPTRTPRSVTMNRAVPLLDFREHVWGSARREASTLWRREAQR